ncbi:MULTISPECIES: ATP synthase F0 subunit C [Bdellovibrio]|uniref:ATP synthase subunit c n=1 Tax=Bdellovibrio bacteriovorus TaxID=959 RepID=A0A150WWI8_BDEBC|nr:MULTISPECIES: ATP synthase F0 subunit C [Bdellovibrio]KHD87258.1 MAG: ATP synthase subunit C [Bdellovibrio sp. ArHS]KYG68982.1 ATP synthase subunit C [Bdellovibrio bacteriovorus]KYG70878.1 ATP synthase subunit C [Bdellovibrio bacteriovorus]
MKKMIVAMVALLASVSAFAQEAAPAATEAAASVATDRGLVAIAAAIAIALSVFAGAMAQGKTASTALDGIARNPAASGKLLIPMILGLALIESLVIYALIIALRLA